MISPLETGGGGASLPLANETLLEPRAHVHVLTLTPFYPREGDDANGCFVAEPLAELSKLGIRNSVFAVQPFYRGRVHGNASAPAARWTRFAALPSGLGLPTSGRLLFAAIRQRVRALQADSSIELIHAHGALPCGHAAMLLSRRLGVPFVVTVHGLDAFSTNQVKGALGKWCRGISQEVYRSAGRVICISERVREQVLEGMPDASTTVIYNGADPQRFRPADGPSSSAVILSVGNLIPIKGHELLLRAIAALPERSEIFCELIGDGPERSRLEALGCELNLHANIRFLGRQNRTQVAEAMRRCTLFALPSRYEGLGCAYLEAMLAAKPVIACRGQGIEEIVQDGLNGRLIEPNDLPGLTETLSLLLRSPQLRTRLGDAARTTILQRFTLAHQAQYLAELYRECTA